jgi:CRP/FNR family transcriptional regulator, cyclic AMP receptor protein
VTPAPTASFLDSLGERAAAALIAESVDRSWPAGSVLFHEGDRADRVLFVVEGRLKLVATERNGSTSLLALRGPGDVIGELAALDERAGARLAAAIAVGPVRCRVVTAERFRTVVSGDAAAAMALARLLAGRLREAEGRRAEHGALGVEARLARRLLDLVDPGSGLVEGLNQDDLGALVGASREAVSKALQSLRAAGLVRTGRRSIEVLDPTALSHRAVTDP